MITAQINFCKCLILKIHFIAAYVTTKKFRDDILDKVLKLKFTLHLKKFYAEIGKLAQSYHQ